MKIPLVPIKKIIIKSFPKLLIISALSIDIILAVLFYNIKAVDPLIIFGTVALALVLEYLYNVFLKPLYLKFAATVLLLNWFVKLLYFYGIESVKQIADIINDINMKVYYSQEILFYDILPLFFIILVLATFLCFSAERKHKGNWIVMLQFIYILYISYYTAEYKNLYSASIFLTIIYICLNLYRRTRINAKKEHIRFSVDFKKLTIYYSIIIIPLFLMAMGLIKTTGTNNISEIREMLRSNILKNISNNIGQLYDISKYGFGTEDKLGGPLILNNDIVLRVESDKPYYLRGTVKNYYTGDKWTRTFYEYNIADKPNQYLLKKEIQKKLIGDLAEKEFIDPKNINVYNENLTSTSLFTPYNTIMVTSDKKHIGRSRDNSYMLLEKDIDYKYYNISFYESLTGFDDFRAFFKNRRKLDYNTNFDNPMNEKEVENMRNFYAAYLQLPDNITERTRNLQMQAVGDAQTVEEKIYNIMEFLKKNYSYELNVSKTPDNVEFLDYFLFEEKKGYCTFFATAAVVFCRLEGIPARYVEGFSMDSTRDQEGLYVVKGSNAHAWCEVLVSAKDNLWAVLESTPASGRPAGNSIEESSNRINKLRARNKHKFDFAKTYNEGSSVSGVRNIINPVIGVLLKTSTIIIILFVVLFIVQVAYMVSRKNKYLKGILSNSKINLLYYYIKDRLEAISIENLPNLSEQEYLDNIQDGELKDIIVEIIAIYEQEYYRDQEHIGRYDKKKYLMQVEEYIRKKQNILSYVVKKYELTPKLNFWNIRKVN